jgi:hypothetical protein
MATCSYATLSHVDTKGMNTEILSFIVRCWRDAQDSTHIQVLSLDNEELALAPGSILLRIWVEEPSHVERCLIRHLSSNREVYVQSGSSLKVFIQECLLAAKPPLPPDTPDAQASP